jgi:general secretion pathway protein D
VPAAPNTTPLVVAQPINLAPTNAPATNAAAQIVDTSTLKFQEVPLAEVLETYQDFTGKTIIRAPNLALTTPITIKVQGELTMKEAIEALDTVLALNGVTMVPMGSKFVKAVPFAQAQQEAAAFSSTMKADEMPEAARYMTRILQLKNAKPSEVVPAIQSFAKLPNSILPVDSTQILILRDYSDNLKRMLEVIEKIDVAIPIEEDFEVIPIKYALASDMASVLGSLTGGGVAGGTTARPTSPRRTALPTGVGSTFGGAGTLGGQPGMGGLQPGQPGHNPAAAGGTTTPGAAANTLQQRLNQIVSRAASGTAGATPYLGEARIMPFERGNSLLVLANKSDMQRVKDVIAKLDVVQQQVLIEAIILDVNLSDDLSLGVSVGQRPVKNGGLAGAGVSNNDNKSLTTAAQLFANLGFGGSTNRSGGTLPEAGGFNYFSRLGPVFDLAITALASDSRVNILSRPRIQATHAEQATLFIGETVPYVTGTYFGGINASASSQYQQLAVGISLNVLPLINPEGLVILEIAQNIEQIGGSVKIDNNDVPKTTRRQAQTKVAVNNGDTIVLGGFISSSKGKTESGVPVLKDIPLLGALFRSKTDKTSRSELMVLLRPTVLPTPAFAAQYTSSERNTLPGVRQAEYEFMKDEMSRRKKLESFSKGKADFDTPFITPGPSAQAPQVPR